MNFDPVELERLSKAATAPGALIADKGAFLVALETAYRTGQLVPAQPSGDEVEAVARAICETLQAQFERFAQEVLDHLDMTPEYWRDTATAAITAYEAVSGVAKMRDALVDDPNWIAAGIPDEAIEAGVAAWDAANEDMQSPSPKKDWDEGMIVAAIFKAVARAALGEKP